MNKIVDIVKEIKELNGLDNKTLSDRVLKFNEEFGEFSAELCKVVGISHKPYDRDHLIEEAADSLQCHFSIIIDVCEKLDIDFDEILQMILIKNQKWRSKIPFYNKPIV
jgi:NTP pyrophosphatase (non-canonical NTP hydrolase)